MKILVLNAGSSSLKFQLIDDAARHDIEELEELLIARDTWRVATGKDPHF